MRWQVLAAMRSDNSLCDTPLSSSALLGCCSTKEDEKHKCAVEVWVACYKYSGNLMIARIKEAFDKRYPSNSLGGISIGFKFRDGGRRERHELLDFILATVLEIQVETRKEIQSYRHVEEAADKAAFEDLIARVIEEVKQQHLAAIESLELKLDHKPECMQQPQGCDCGYASRASYNSGVRSAMSAVTSAPIVWRDLLTETSTHS